MVEGAGIAGSDPVICLAWRGWEYPRTLDVITGIMSMSKFGRTNLHLLAEIHGHDF